MNSIIPVNKDMKLYSQPKLKVEFFSEEDLFKMFDWIMRKRQEAKRKRDIDYYNKYYLIMKFLLRTGARIDEALMVRPIDINIELNTITLITLKKKEKDVKRIIPLHPDLKTDIMQYYLEYNINKKSEERLFNMTRQSVDLFFKKMQKDLGFKIHAHKFRHTFAVKAILSGVPINILQKWLSHSSIFITSIYTDVTGMDTSQFMNQVL
ncbi:MAG: tyrosine-type recombinase/integrase [Euryarchaeota archaeon]|nr:tyrosine-type recombinase/integrase [Euryarchaeota archaeon]